MKKTVTVTQLMGKDGGVYFGDTLVMPEQYRVDVIQLHFRPHFEEIVAVATLRAYGEDMFPGVGNARAQLVDAGVKHPDALEQLKQGVLQVGLGNGPLNEHETNERLAIDGECAATLVAKILHVDEEPCLTGLLKYALRSDTTSIGPMELSSVLKVLYEYHPESEVLEWGLKVAESLLLKQMDFHGAAKQALENAIKTGHGAVLQTAVRGGKTVTVVWAVGEEPNIAAYARSKTGYDAAVVIHESLPGKFYIPANKRAALDLGEVVRLLRIAELHARGIDQFPENLYEKLADEVCEEVPEWYFDRTKTGSVFGGGSRSNKDAPLSRLDIRKVVSCVRRGLIRRQEHNGDSSKTPVSRDGHRDSRHLSDILKHKWQDNRVSRQTLEPKCPQTAASVMAPVAPVGAVSRELGACLA